MNLKDVDFVQCVVFVGRVWEMSNKFEEGRKEHV